MLRIEGGSCRLLGAAGARLFRQGQQPVELAAGTVLDDLLQPQL
jgi:hypothetical protein